MTHTDEAVADSVLAERRPLVQIETKSILVAVDFSDASQAALLWACGYAAKAAARIEVLHVIHDPPESPGTYKPGNGDVLQPMADAAEDMMTEFMDRTRWLHPDMEALEGARTLMREGLPVNAIIDVAEERGVDLVVMGSRGRNALQRLVLGSTTERVLRHSQIPVTVVKSMT